MKKLIVLLTVVCFTLSFAAIFAGCGKEEPAPVPKPVVKKPAPTPKPVLKAPTAPSAPATIKKKGGDDTKKKPKPSSKPATIKKKGGKKKKK